MAIGTDWKIAQKKSDLVISPPLQCHFAPVTDGWDYCSV